MCFVNLVSNPRTNLCTFEQENHRKNDKKENSWNPDKTLKEIRCFKSQGVRNTKTSNTVFIQLSVIFSLC